MSSTGKMCECNQGRLPCTCKARPDEQHERVLVHALSQRWPIATGEQLDAIGEMYGVARDGKSDDAYRRGIAERIIPSRQSPAEQHQGDAIGTLVRDYNERIVFTPIGDPHIIDDMKVYAHADTGEVERLRAEVEQTRSSLIKTVRASDDANIELAIKCDALRAQLAEAQALLREWRHGHHYTLKSCASILQRTDAALSASAEPRAPVERDERAEFERWMGESVTTSSKYREPISSRRSEVLTAEGLHLAWEGWQARAALERKP